jgi:hypothetical protein
LTQRYEAFWSTGTSLMIVIMISDGSIMMLNMLRRLRALE